MMAQPKPKARAKPHAKPHTYFTPFAGGAVAREAMSFSADPNSATAWAFRLDNSRVFYHFPRPVRPTGAQDARANSTAPVPSRDRLQRHLALYELVGKLPSLPIGHPMAVEADVAKHALQVLDYLAGFEDQVPSVFAHGGDAVVLKWEDGDISRYLTVGGNDVNLLEMRRTDANSKSETDYDLEDAQQRQALLEAIGSIPSSASTLVDAT